METGKLLRELDLGAKPWHPGNADADHLSRMLSGREAREAWKYTPIGTFVETYVARCSSMPQAASLQSLHIEGASQPGVTVTELADLNAEDLRSVRAALAAVDAKRYPLAELSTLHNKSGYLIKITGALAQPIEIVHHDGEQLLLIDVAEGASASIIETSEQEDFGSAVTLLSLGAGCRLVHGRSALLASAMHVSLLEAAVSQGAEYELQQYLVGGRRRRADCHITLDGEGASVTVTGAFVTEDGAHLDQQLVVEHKAPRTASNQTIHGIGMGKSRSVFNGRIHIHPGANGADGQLSNKNLSLNPGADINTKPELEIYTDDVKCAHGATVGQLDPEHLFYLRSRGLSESQSRSLLCNAFVRSCVRGPLTASVTDRFTACLT